MWDPQEGYDHVLNGVRHHFDSILQRKRKNRYAVTALRRLFTLPCHLQYVTLPSSVHVRNNYCTVHMHTVSTVTLINLS